MSLQKLNLKPGEFLVWRFSSSSKAANIFRAIKTVQAQLPKGVNILALLGDEKIETLSEESLRGMGLQRIQT